MLVLTFFSTPKLCILEPLEQFWSTADVLVLDNVGVNDAGLRHY
jgi:hypothetical protein